MKINECTIQNRLYKEASYIGQHKYICPSVYLYRWESDLISVTKSGFVHEYEIKCSKADYKADFKKDEKHNILKYRPGDMFNTDTGKRPNYFWYVSESNIIDTVPEYAGLIHVEQIGKNMVLKTIKKAPRLHIDKISNYQKIKLLTSIYYRFWPLRLEKKLNGK